MVGVRETGGKPKPAQVEVCPVPLRVSRVPGAAGVNSSAPLTRPDFHRYEDYGELTFVKWSRGVAARA